MDLKLAGKVVLITGSSRGIGLATAKAFAADGRRIMLSARSAEQLRDAEAALRDAGASVASHAADVGDPADAARLIDATVAAYGGIDLLVNNVGGGGGGARIVDSSDDDWRGALERNLVQTVRMMRLALPHMKGRPGAAVINIASISGWTPLAGAQFLLGVIAAFPYRLHTVLTDNGIPFTDQPRNRSGPIAEYGLHAFDRVCRDQGIAQKLTKPYHPWTNGG